MAWFFLRVTACQDLKEVKALKKQIKELGRVYTCDLGTEVDPDAGWFVVQVTGGTVTGVRDKLGELGSRVNLIEPLLFPKEGRAMARQLELF